jgi:hypothetical protein
MLAACEMLRRSARKRHHASGSMPLMPEIVIHYPVLLSDPPQPPFA